MAKELCHYIDRPKRARPFVHASLSLLRQLRVKRTSCINKEKETKSAIGAHITSITQLQESITKLQKDLLSKQEASSALQTQLKSFEIEQGSLNKEIENLEGELGALSHPNFSLQNINVVIDII